MVGLELGSWVTVRVGGLGLWRPLCVEAEKNGTTAVVAIS